MDIQNYVQPQIVIVGDLYDMDLLYIVTEGSIICQLPQLKTLDAVLGLLVKRRTPTDEELEQLGIDIAKDWNRLGRRLQLTGPILQEINKAHDQLSEKGYHMLKRWKENNGADATYQALCDALQHKLVQRQDLAEKFCYIKVSSTSHFQQDAHRRIIFSGTVSVEASSFFSKENGVWLAFSPKTVAKPKRVTCYSWSRSAEVVRLEDDETLVSSIIQLECDDPAGVTFTGITLALSHSAVESKEYELVMKELINTEEKTWKDLKTPLEPLDESQSELQFVQATITSFSFYAVIFRLKSHTFQFDESVKSPEFTCQVIEYPGTSVTIPTRSMSKGMAMTIKVQHVPNDDFEEKRVFVSPILHINCPMEGELAEPVSITMPIALEQDQRKVQNVEASQVRLCSRSKIGSPREWIDITDKLEPPAKLEDGVLSFQVKSTDSSYSALTTDTSTKPEELDIPGLLNQDVSVQHYAGFQACLCDIGRPAERQLILSCYPHQSKNTLLTEISSGYKVVCRGQQRSQYPLKKGDKVFFSLSDALVPCGESGKESSFLRFLEDDSFEKNFPVRVEKHGSFPQVTFFKQGITLCILSMLPVLPRQQNHPETSKDIPDESVDKEQSEGPCEQEGKQSEPLSEEEGKPSKQPSLLEEAPPEIIARGPLTIQTYHKALLEGKVTVKRLPIMLIGHCQSGKTSVKKSLRGERFDPEEPRTTGIEAHTSYCKVVADLWKVEEENQTAYSEPRPIAGTGEDKEEIHSVLWDFGGESAYYITHPLFLSRRGIYCIIYNLSQEPAKTVGKRSNRNYLENWMFLVSSLVSRDQEPKTPADSETPASEMLSGKLIPPVFLVCTHADEPYRTVQPKELAREITESLQTALHGQRLSDVFIVNNTKSGSEQECPEVNRLKNEIINITKELPQMKEVIPIKWLKYEKALAAKVGDGFKWISLDDSRNIALDICGISSEEQFLTLLNFLHDQRALIHFNDTPELNKIVILDLQWLTDVLKKVLTVTLHERRQRKSMELWRKLETTGVLDNKLLRHVWRPLFDGRDTWKSLIAIMEKLCLLNPRSSSSEGASHRNYIVPSMLMFPPPKEDVAELIECTGIPSLFVRFESGQVPPGLFSRLVLMFFQWCTKEWLYQSEPELHRNFAGFHSYPTEGCSVILLCHSSLLEVVVLMGDSGIHPSSPSSNNFFQVNTARMVHRQLVLMLECMRSEFHWLKNMAYEMLVCCLVCCKPGSENHCREHTIPDCKQQECLHLWSESQCKDPITCTKSAVAGNDRIPVRFFAPWFKSVDEQQIAVGGGRDGQPVPDDREQVIDLPGGVLEALQLRTCDANDVVVRLQESLSLTQASLEKPGKDTQRLIRCLCMKAKAESRVDVVKKLRGITSAGTTGPLLPEALDVLNIPFRKRQELTTNLSGGDEWKLFSETLGLTPAEIHFLEKRVINPCDVALSHSRKQGFIRSVGDLYDALVKCNLPVMADLL